jgi:hypothetical protein
MTKRPASEGYKQYLSAQRDMREWHATPQLSTWPSVIELCDLPDPITNWNGVFTMQCERDYVTGEVKHVKINDTHVYEKASKTCSNGRKTAPVCIVRVEETWALKRKDRMNREAIIYKCIGDQLSPIGSWECGAYVKEVSLSQTLRNYIESSRNLRIADDDITYV